MASRCCIQYGGPQLICNWNIVKNNYGWADSIALLHTVWWSSTYMYLEQWFFDVKRLGITALEDNVLINAPGHLYFPNPRKKARYPFLQPGNWGDPGWIRTPNLRYERLVH